MLSGGEPACESNTAMSDFAPASELEVTTATPELAVAPSSKSWTTVSFSSRRGASMTCASARVARDGQRPKSFSLATASTIVIGEWTWSKRLGYNEAGQSAIGTKNLQPAAEGGRNRESYQTDEDEIAYCLFVVQMPCRGARESLQRQECSWLLFRQERDEYSLCTRGW